MNKRVSQSTRRSRSRPRIIALVAIGGLFAAGMARTARLTSAPPESKVTSQAAGVASSVTRKSGAKKTPGIDDWTIPHRYRNRVMPLQPRAFRPKLIALTFDDGPDPKVTPQILKQLRDYGAKATFFVLGRQAERYPDLLKDIVRDGHAIGNHSFSHPKTVSPEQAALEIDSTDACIRRAVGRSTLLFRPPYGLRSDELASEALKKSYTVVLWSLPSLDVTRINSQRISQIVVNGRKRGDVVVMHDGPGHKRTAQALPAILEALSRKGYRFVTVPEMLRHYDYVNRVREQRANPAAAAPQLKKNGAPAKTAATSALSAMDGTK